jgi:hypothetical protein
MSVSINFYDQDQSKERFSFDISHADIEVAK